MAKDKRKTDIMRSVHRHIITMPMGLFFLRPIPLFGQELIKYNKWPMSVTTMDLSKISGAALDNSFIVPLSLVLREVLLTLRMWRELLCKYAENKCCR